jgi:heme exporter protein B
MARRGGIRAGVHGKVNRKPQQIADSRWLRANRSSQIANGSIPKRAQRAVRHSPSAIRRFMIFFRQLYAILAKELQVEWRTKETLSAMLVFALLVLVIFNFAFDLQGVEIQVLGPGVLWVAFSFSGIIGLGRSFAAERDRGSMDGMLLAPVDRGAIFLGKALANFLFILAMEIVTLPLFVILFNVPLEWFPLVGYILMGTLGFSAVGTLLSAIAASTRMREVMLPVLLFPVLVPLLVASVKITQGSLQGAPFSDFQGWFNLLLAYDVIFLVVAYLVFEFVVEE